MILCFRIFIFIQQFTKQSIQRHSSKKKREERKKKREKKKEKRREEREKKKKKKKKKRKKEKKKKKKKKKKKLLDSLNMRKRLKRVDFLVLLAYAYIVTKFKIKLYINVVITGEI